VSEHRPPQEREPDEHLERALRARRPRPARQFGEALRERLVQLELSARRPAHLWTLVIVYALCGAVLLALAAAGAVGAGPFG
jgi:hypothetical protein